MYYANECNYKKKLSIFSACKKKDKSKKEIIMFLYDSYMKKITPRNYILIVTFI